MIEQHERALGEGGSLASKLQDITKERERIKIRERDTSA